MSSNTAEEQMKQKIDELDTLQAGIVYGKEDAWDKLQSRLDAKPISKLLPIYRIAAAAALVLLCTTFAMFYYQPQPTTLVQHTINEPTIKKTPSSTPQPNAEPTIIVSTAKENNPSPAHHNAAKKAAQPSVTNNDSTHIPPPAIAEAKQPITEQPVVITQPTMKVVHINDIDKEATNSYTDVVDTREIPHPHVMFKMKVVHINDLLKPIPEEDYRREMERNTAWHFPFSRKALEDRTNNNGPRNLIRINLSNQN